MYNIYIDFFIKSNYHESGAFRPKVEHCDHSVPKCGCIATLQLEHCDFVVGGIVTRQ